MLTQLMKTTLELPDELLIEAKAVANRRRVTLKSMIEHALRREIQPQLEIESEKSHIFEAGPLGILRLKKRGTTITSEMIYKLMDADEDVDLATIVR